MSIGLAAALAVATNRARRVEEKAAQLLVLRNTPSSRRRPPFFGEKVLGVRGLFLSEKKIKQFGPSAVPGLA